MDADGHYTQLRSETAGAGPEQLGTHQTLIELTKHRQATA